MSKEGKMFSRANLWLQALSKRERIMVLAALFLVPVYLFVQLMYLPGVKRQQGLSTQCESIKQQNESLQAQIVELSSAVDIDPNAQQRHQIDTLHQEIASFDRTLQESVAGMVPPQRMAQLLREMLQQRVDLTLVSLKNLPPQPLLTVTQEVPAEDQTAARQPVTDDNSTPHVTPADVTLYRHGVELQFRGSYMATVRYFSSLQQLPQRLFWDAVSIESDKYPQQYVRVKLYTLSPEKGWISG